MAYERILLVEDDHDQRTSLVGLLRSEGYDVDECSTAEEALGHLDTNDYDLLVTDYLLGGATGAWLARIAAARVGSIPPRVLLITGHERPSDVDGLNVIRKPINAANFLTDVARALATEPRERTIADPAQRIALVYYVTDSVHSLRAVKTLRAILKDYEPSQVALTIIDVSRGSCPEAEDDRIIATPTLVKTFPAPRTWIAGELATREHVQRLLEHASVERRR